MAVETKAGKYRHLMVIEEDRGSTQNELGEEVEDWRELCQRWASIEPLKSWQIFNARQAQSGATHVIRMRAELQLELNPLRIRLRLGERLFYLEGEPRDVEERGAEWEMTAIERRIPA